MRRINRQLICRACGKRRYATKQTAEQDMGRIRAVSYHDRLPERTYQCTRGWWHLTSSTDPMDTRETA